MVRGVSPKVEQRQSRGCVEQASESINPHAFDHVALEHSSAELCQEGPVFRRVRLVVRERLDVRSDLFLQTHADDEEIDAVVIQHVADRRTGQLLEAFTSNPGTTAPDQAPSIPAPTTFIAAESRVISRGRDPAADGESSIPDRRTLRRSSGIGRSSAGKILARRDVQPLR